MMDYLLKANGLVLLLFVFYHLVLKNETFFKWNRNFFLIGLLLVVIIPLTKIPIYVETTVNEFNNLNYQEIASAFPKNASFDWTKLVSSIYILGILVFATKFIIQLLSLGIFLKSMNFKKIGNLYFAETTKNTSPFSFFNYIIYNPNQFSKKELQQIINHEKAHAIQQHSVDTLISNLMVILLWFNPFAWLLKKSIQQNLEFLADNSAQKLSANYEIYQLSLVKIYSKNYQSSLTNNFYNSLIKKRIIMLRKNKSKNTSKWKFAILAPLLALFMLAFNTQVIAQEKKLNKINESRVDLIINKNSTNDKLSSEKETFKNKLNIDLSFKGIKRNSNNEITAIKIDAKGPNLRAKFENSGNKPINPIRISYDANQNSISISNAKKSHYMHNIHKMTHKDGNFVIIASDGKKNKWIEKHNKLKGDKNTMWIYKTDEDNDSENTKVIVIKNGKKHVEIIDDNDTGINTDDDGNVFIIKQKSDKNGKHISHSKINMISYSSDNEKPLFLIDGKEFTNEKLEKMDSNTIEKMEVLKGENAIAKYGDKGKNGVILITTKKE